MSNSQTTFRSQLLQGLTPGDNLLGFADPPVADPPDPAATLTAAEVEHIVQGRIATEKAKSAELEAKLAQQATDQAETNKTLLAEIDKLKAANPPEPEPEPADLDGKLKLVKKEAQEQIDLVTKQVDEYKNQAEAERISRLATEKNALVTSALVAADCLADEAALGMGAKHFDGQIFYDEERHTHLFELQDGGKVTIMDGVAAEMPAFLQRPQLAGGGSGSRTGVPGEATPRQIEDAQKKMKDLENIAKATGKSSDINKYTEQKRKLARLQQDMIQV